MLAVREDLSCSQIGISSPEMSNNREIHDYIYGAPFSVVTDNNPLMNVFTTAELDATSQRWLVELSKYNCTVSYRSGKQNLDADGLSRILETGTSVTIFPDVLEAAYNSISVEHQPFVDSLTNAAQKDIDPKDASTIEENTIKYTALMGKYRRKAQT